jgi:lysyl-tRNA synthetase class 2
MVQACARHHSRTTNVRFMKNTRHAAFRLRAELYQLIRTFFAERSVLEVETPILSAAGYTEPNIESFRTDFTGHVDAGVRRRYLRTSAEYPMKRLLAEGLGDCYELGRVFRNGEAGRHHNPEFSMLEWYRLGMDHHELAEETVELVQCARRLPVPAASGIRAVPSSRHTPGPVEGCDAIDKMDSGLRRNDEKGQRRDTRISTYRDLFRDALDIDPFTANLDTLRAPLAEFHIDPDGLTHDDWLDLLLTHRIQPGFPRGQITVIHDWPASQCALARIREGDPPVAERFELYLGPHELANGYHELNDSAEQRRRFARENRKREQRGQAALPLDENLLATLDAMPPCAGVALGIERLLMCLMDTDRIADVMAYTFGEA